jgi:hypothetical protein
MELKGAATNARGLQKRLSQKSARSYTGDGRLRESGVKPLHPRLRRTARIGGAAGTLAGDPGNPERL